MTTHKNPEQNERILKLQLRLAQIEKTESAQMNFLDFVKAVWPEFIAGEHHRIIANKLERVASGELKRLIINMAPRHTKSEFASFLFPAWMMGKKPNMKIIQATHTTELAVGFGRKTKNLIERDDYKTIFDVKLAADSKASGRWDTDRGGMYYAVGVGSNLAGRGKDLTGQLLRAQARDPKSDQWEIVELPAIMPSGKSCWPEYWPIDELEKVKASIPPSKWNAQYQQDPTGDDNSILKREWWKIWEKEKIPPLQYVIQSYDTAFSKKETADFSAITTWGVFYPNESGAPALMLLDVQKGRWDFPELKAIAFEQYKFWEPETVIIEAKASGMPLTHELRQTGIPVVNFTPSRGNDKISRAHAIAPLFESGMIWAPDEQWAHELIEECAAFPNGEYDDLVDSTTQALMRYRQGNFVQLPTDDWEDDSSQKIPVGAYYG
jgi:predicted phage terminase large subunit-like protein